MSCKFSTFLFFIVTSAGLFLLSSCSILLDTDGLMQRSHKKARVISVPAGSLEYHEIAPYRGLHPSLIERPSDPFPYPIRIGETGPVEPLYAGPLTYPFLCQSEESKLGQPLVDNHQQAGVAVYAIDEQGEKTDQLMGYSMDCSIPTRAYYYYNRKGTRKFYPLEEADEDIARIVINGEEVDFIVRLELGTINRFIYSIAALKGPNGTLHTPDKSRWNGRLAYHFKGGVGIGRKQGRNEPKTVLNDRYDQLAAGYAVAFSSGNKTSNHFNIWLAEDTARRVKHQFVSLYGEPLYTVGIGASGGAIQQYLLGQNSKGIIDAAIPQYSFPDMVTQLIYALDCDLTEYYFDITDRENRMWENWENRMLVQGLSAHSVKENRYANIYRLAMLMNGYWPSAPSGASECAMEWRGPAQIALNPRFYHHYNRYSDNLVKNTHWSHWEDLKEFYGVNKAGFARSFWDNVGVQYGLQALRNGEIDAEQFLQLNSRVGGWKNQQDMEPARFWIYGGDSKLTDFSMWSHHNMKLDDQQGYQPARRTEGDLLAIEAAYRAGLVFVGRIDIPVIDIRHYLDGEVNMHHSFASLTTRQRMIEEKGNADNQVIWVADKAFDPTVQAFQVMDSWMLALLNDPPKTVAEAKPASAEDTCFDKNGSMIAKGGSVWDGEWNNKSAGKCTESLPHYRTTRQVAGGSISGDVFKCQLQSVEAAMENGVYGKASMTPYQNRLKRIFPSGVCDYTKPGAGRPEDLFASNKKALPVSPENL